MARKPVVLIIRDGWGVNPGGQETAIRDGNAVELANTPFHDKMAAKYPRGLISASGMDVGLPEGQMGNSEVGHLNLGAGRIVYQDLTRINKCIADGELGKNEILKDAFAKAKNKGKRLHFIGLISDGGVHSHQDHLIALVKEAKAAGVDDMMIHAITDGRDTSPTGGAAYLSHVENGIAPYGAKIATVIGRYYAMDRDRRWERTQLAWDAIVQGKGTFKEVPASEAVAERYQEDETDEFMQPMIFSEHESQRINDDDVVLFINFRADRARQLSEVFLTEGFCDFETGVIPKVNYVTLTEYDENYRCPIVFSTQTLEMVLGEAVAKAGKNQLRIAETEKYPHVSYFFNGGLEQTFEGEDRKVVPSPKDVATYDLKPEMSSVAVEDYVLEHLKDYDLVIINFANPDMVGHTGVVDAAVKAVERIDAATQTIVEETLRLGGSLLITADHGNAEFMRNADGSPHTAHTTNLVHCYYVSEAAEGKTMKDGILADIAPTLIELLGIEKPTQMTGKSLIS